MEFNKKKLALIILFLTFVAWPDRGFAQEEEFVGPFPSWANVKTRFGARGDGKTDDTKSIQQALDHLANYLTGTDTSKMPYTVVYFPAGTYLISGTLHLKGKIGISIIGENPNNTILKWVGGDNDTMLLANGSAYYKIARFTWNGNNKKNIEALGIHWMNKWNEKTSRSYATLNIDLADMQFMRCAVGIGGGTMEGAGTGSNDSEISIKRCIFNACTEAGIKITGFNALDYWIWYCQFNNCKQGVYCAHGNYHIYKCNFIASTESDIHNKGGFYTSVRESFSYNSKAFSIDEGASCNPFKRIFYRNTVLNYKGLAVEYYHLGNLTMFDNNFTKAYKKDTPDIGLGSWCPGYYSYLSLDNKYSFKDPVRLTMQRKNMMRGGDVIQNIQRSKPVKASVPALPAFLPQKKYPVFDIPALANGNTIQQIIDKAALSRKKTVIHFPAGKYYLDKPLVIPASSDLILIGDGLAHASVITVRKANSKETNLLQVFGPAKLAIYDLQLGEFSTDKKINTAIYFNDIDQKESRLVIDQLYSQSDTSLWLEKFNYLYVEKNNSFFSEGNFLSGGARQQEGKGTFKVRFNGGQFARTFVMGNTDLIARDCWWEGTTRRPIDLTGDGKITLDGAMISPWLADSTATININRFKGSITLMNIYMYGGLKIDPNNPDLTLLGWNIHFYHNIHPTHTLKKTASYKALLSGFSAQCYESNNPDCNKILSFEPVSRNVADTMGFIRQMSAQTRLPMRTIPNRVSPIGSSSIFIQRVSIGSANSGLKAIQR